MFWTLKISFKAVVFVTFPGVKTYGRNYIYWNSLLNCFLLVHCMNSWFLLVPLFNLKKAINLQDKLAIWKNLVNPVILSQLVHLADPVHAGDILDESPVHAAAVSLCTVYSQIKISRIFFLITILVDFCSNSRGFNQPVFSFFVSLRTWFFYRIEVAPVPRIDMHRMQIISGLEWWQYSQPTH